MRDKQLIIDRIKNEKCPICGKDVDLKKCREVIDVNVGKCLICEHHFDNNKIVV